MELSSERCAPQGVGAWWVVLYPPKSAKVPLAGATDALQGLIKMPPVLPCDKRERHFEDEMAQRGHYFISGQVECFRAFYQRR